MQSNSFLSVDRCVAGSSAARCRRRPGTSHLCHFQIRSPRQRLTTRLECDAIGNGEARLLALASPTDADHLAIELFVLRPTAAEPAARFDSDVANRVRLILTVAGTGANRVTTGDDTRGTGTGLRSGCVSGATFAALPMPLGSLIEPLSPRAFAGPGGMPLTPAS